MSTVAYGYDAYGKLTTITRGATVYGMTYDGWNRPVATKVGAVALSTNGYDEYKRLSTVTYANGFVVRYEYDDLDRVTKIYEKHNNTESLAYEFLYNNEGDLYAVRNRKTDPGRVSLFEYDHAGRCMACTERAFTVSGGQVTLGAVLSGYRYEYDANNNLTKLTCTAAGSAWETVYTYDKDNRTVTATFASGKVLTNTYDNVGRVTRKRLGLTSNYDTTLSYVAGANGSQTALLSTYQNGSDTAYEYSYDDNGKITSITRGSTSVTYEYNGANELVRENNGFTNHMTTYGQGAVLRHSLFFIHAIENDSGRMSQSLLPNYRSIERIQIQLKNIFSPTRRKNVELDRQYNSEVLLNYRERSNNYERIFDH